VSAKILVLAVGEPLPAIPVDQLRRHGANCIKHSVAKLRVRQLVAEWVIRGAVIRMLAILPAALHRALTRRPHTRETPNPSRIRFLLLSPTPPREVPNCKFQQPPSAQWRIPRPDWSKEGLVQASTGAQKCTMEGAEFA